MVNYGQPSAALTSRHQPFVCNMVTQCNGTVALTCSVAACTHVTLGTRTYMASCNLYPCTRRLHFFDKLRDEEANSIPRPCRIKPLHQRCLCLGQAGQIRQDAAC